MKEIRFEHVNKAYGETQVVNDLTMTITGGERLILLGPSGCGKSTTLRMIAGLEEITAGSLFMGGRQVNHVPSGNRNVAMVFQNYALYPHMTVKNNIIYGLKVQKLPKQEVARRLETALNMLELSGYEDRLPKDLSGGQRQRVALARAVVKQADYILLDEPLSNLDAQLRVSARKELVKVHELYKPTMVYVTHDQIEAMTVADRIALMNKGELQMLDTPENVYHHPVNIFTASFIGSPPTNLIEARFADGVLMIGRQTLKLDAVWTQHVRKSGLTQLVLGIRPEHISLSSIPVDESFLGVVKHVENHGAGYAIYTEMERHELVVMDEVMRWQKGDHVFIRPKMNHLHFFDPETTGSIGYPEQQLNDKWKGRLKA